ncbi:hypothetical protein AMIS_47930 [Actinoplanes missouriensis 431]|uniref:2'-5' RNA ligase n=1 Tax=Actinoplanes missouriensis (strain ATCC 14538 / DSM 43046 / CBS 188.64 / JCM 3121 / NBRC 102363 / NCIMB 12654 / NRRL B-3342 / UNCC 431) TaxID=512565 RepID=I0HAH6_ACTM4|nr:2'-5' RNA ligase family protein [Actinoplanes missouriensis]BAL90013.1 hypothetical protein AMIS_47930 [Actinoplanes missouriensis 431]
MKPFAFRHGAEPWPPGETLLHVYVIPDLDQNPELAALTAGCREALAPYPLACVEDRWLHITLAQIADVFGSAYSEAERAELAAALTGDLAGFGSFSLTVGSCLAQASVVMFDVHPDDRIAALGTRVREVIGRVRGPGALSSEAGIAHMTIGYANGDADNAAIQRDLRRVRPGHATMRVSAVQLVDVSVDAEAKTVTWRPIATIPLG